MPWQGLTQWRILDTDFGNGDAFFSFWQLWQADAQRPRMLHYVALSKNAPSQADWRRLAQCEANLNEPSQALAKHWFGLLPGFHRFLLSQGHVVLTLCIGATLPLLRQQQFAADSIFLRESTRLPDGDLIWLAKALAACSQRGTRLQAIRPPATHSSSVLLAALQHCGFTIANTLTTTDCEHLIAHYEPAWTLKNTRATRFCVATPVGRCAVIGAGLAGASVAAALARRGWQVHVHEQAANPAAGASGLPVGLIAPYVSKDDSALSQLSRAGVRLMLQQAKALLEAGADWAPVGVLERHIGGTPSLPGNWPDAGHAWSTLARPALPPDAWRTGFDTARDLWHAQAAWLKPAALVHAWLNQSGVQFTAGHAVARICRQQGQWTLKNSQGTVLDSADRVVIANASAATLLLQALSHDYPHLANDLKRVPAMHGMRGQLSWGRHADAPSAAFAPFGVNGSGSLIAGVPTELGLAWFAGSSYQPADQVERGEAENHLRNLQHLQLLLPTLANELAAKFIAGQLNAWKGTRCISADRLPAVGALDAAAQSGLWLCAGMGSRGLSLSMLCAEILAAQWCAEPLPVEAKLAQLLAALRC